MSVTNPAERDELNRLLIETGRNDQKAFAELYRLTSSKLFGVCMRGEGQRHYVADHFVAQQGDRPTAPASRRSAG
jgi:hypothetical protein